MNNGFSTYAEAELYRRKVQRRQRIIEKFATVLGGFFGMLAMEVLLILTAVL